MAIKIILFVVFILATIGTGIWAGISFAEDKGNGGKIAGSILAVLFLILTIAVPGNIHQVDTGEVAVVRHLGKVSGTREAGVHWDSYFTNKYEKYDTKVRDISIETQTYSNDNQIIGVIIKLQYAIDAAQVDKIATEYGSIEKLESKITSIALDNIKSVFAKNTATAIINSRTEIVADISKAIQESVNPTYYIKYNNEYVIASSLTDNNIKYYKLVNNEYKEVSYKALITYYVDLKQVTLENIDFTDDFEAAVAAKVAQEQKKQQALIEQEQQLAQALNDKEIAIARAQAEAEAARLKAEAEAEVARIKAEADKAVAQIGADSAEYQGKKEASIAMQRLASINGWTVVTTDEGLNTLVKPDGTLVTDAELKVGAENLIKYYYTQQWNGILPETYMSSDDVSTVIIP